MVLELSTAESQQTDSRLEGRIACITGAGSGIGRATALRFAASGARIICADISPGSSPISEEINNKFGQERAIFVECNVQDEKQIAELIEKTVQWAGRLDIMCNYAGIAVEANYGQRQRIHETDVSDLDRTFAVNVRGVWLCCKHALKQMLEQEPLPPNARGDRTRGWIINAASMFGLVAVANNPSYVASKHAVMGMTKQIAIDYAADKIHCNAICPGYVKSPLTTNVFSDKEVHDAVAALHPWGSWGRPEDIADAGLFLASDDA